MSEEDSIITELDEETGEWEIVDSEESQESIIESILEDLEDDA